MTEKNNNVPDPIAISFEATFHGIRDAGWNSKLIQFPRGGVLWGLHLSKQRAENGIASRIIGCLVCFGPIKEHSSNWSITFDHFFALSQRNGTSVGSLQKSCCFSGRHHIINNYEWGDNKSHLPANWDTQDSVKLSCHMQISQVIGLERDLLKDAASPTTHENINGPLTSPQVENLVMNCFTDLLVNENIVYSDEGLEAAEKLSLLFCFPNVLETCRRYLMRVQSGKVTSDIDEESRRNLVFDLTDFDYHGNSSLRKQRMENLNENDIIAMFQHLCSIAFKKC